MSKKKIQEKHYTNSEQKKMINVTLEVIRLSHEAPQLPILENPRQSFASFSPVFISTLGVAQLILTFSMRLSPEVSIEYVLRLGYWSHHILTCLVAFFFFPILSLTSPS